MGYMEKVLQIVLQARDEASKEIEKIGEKLTEASGSAKKMQESMRLAGGVLTGVGLAGIGIMKSWVDSAAEAQVQIARYESTLKNATDQMNLSETQIGDLKGEIDRLSNSYIKLGFDDEVTQQVMAKNLLVTKDLTMSKQMLAVAADLARYRSIGLEEAQQALQNVLMGNDRVAKGLGLTFDETATIQQKFDQIGQQVYGNAAKYSETLQGKMDTLSLSVDNLKQRLGDRLIPELTKFAETILKVIQELDKLNPEIVNVTVTVVALGTAFSVIAGPILVILSYMPKVAQAAQWVATAITSMSSASILSLGGLGAGVLAVGGLFAWWQVLMANADSQFTKNMGNWNWWIDTFNKNIKFMADNLRDQFRPQLEWLGEKISWVSGLFERLYGWIKRVADSGFAGIASAAGGGMRGYADGGFVPMTGPAVVHQGEYVLSNAMLSGRQSIDSRILAALGNGGGRNVTINLGGVSVNNKSDADYLVAQLSYQMRASGGM